MEQGQSKGCAQVRDILVSLQGEACIMGAKRIYKKRKSERKCMQGKYAGAMESEPCVCTEADFDW